MCASFKGKRAQENRDFRIESVETPGRAKALQHTGVQKNGQDGVQRGVWLRPKSKLIRPLQTNE